MEGPYLSVWKVGPWPPETPISVASDITFTSFLQMMELLRQHGRHWEHKIHFWGKNINIYRKMTDFYNFLFLKGQLMPPSVTPLELQGQFWKKKYTQLVGYQFQTRKPPPIHKKSIFCLLLKDQNRKITCPNISGKDIFFRENYYLRRLHFYKCNIHPVWKSV